ncbi:hypothetical protein VSS37_18760 [Candidatus Thiothrix sp. Deng01]|uniref:Uncharacterized protein n=1 Tax=Candidatus Thiothrix phosphatis TaxID=3112415 RepID=A0ABU6D3Y7_9GAMM|nr:hypothetical protein [Candidatus Thiothrix sp. Deng01]MEB4593028.1 hypothetical protein [Candidatus Thiothrix sp. Deng01]
MKKCIPFVAVMVAFSAGNGYANINDQCQYLSDENDNRNETRCQCYTRQADYYESRMRAGYAASEYDQLEEKRKYFKDKAFNCKPRK